MPLSRRDALLALFAAGAAQGAKPSYQVGITTNTRGGWEKDVFLSFQEAREVGYRYVESFVHYFTEFFDKPRDLRAKIEAIGVKFVTDSSSGGE